MRDPTSIDNDSIVWSLKMRHHLAQLECACTHPPPLNMNKSLLFTIEWQQSEPHLHSYCAMHVPEHVRRAAFATIQPGGGGDYLLYNYKLGIAYM